LLAIILGNAKLLEMDIPSEAPGREELDAISGAGNRAKTLVRQILSFARQDPGQFKLIDLYDVTEEALSLLRATLPKSITTKARVGRSANIHGDPTQMHQIVMNLCINARDAIDDQPGKLVIDLGEAYPALDWPAPPDKGADPDASAQRVVFQQIGNRSFMWMGTQPTNEHIRLTVSDDGSGIDPETFKKIFDPFFTTKDVGKGTGLGLAAVLGIIQSHGGSMHVQSTPGEGTKFEIRLPRQDVEIPVLVDEPLKEEEGSGRVLVVDDEDQIVAVLRKSLERKGYEVTGMTDPARALEAVKSEPDRWDVVVTDINMPGLTGIQIAQSIHAAIPDMPVILCSGSLELMPQHDLDDPYYNSVLEKPVQESDLFLAIQRGMAEKNAEREQ
jgi:CheY-like chemotaxis protein